MTNNCPYVCDNKTEFGYCKTTVCINPKYNQFSVTKWLEKAEYVQVIRCKDCKWFDITAPSGTVEPIGYRCKLKNIFVDMDDFCKRGERREK